MTRSRQKKTFETLAYWSGSKEKIVVCVFAPSIGTNSLTFVVYLTKTEAQELIVDIQNSIAESKKDR